MNKIVLFLISFFVVANLYAQTAQFKDERRIYLWDVTLSTKGFGGTPNIYDKVVNALKKDINSISDEETEIVVLPFQERVLKEWRYKADAAGKKALIREIENYKNEEVTRTNICTPLRDAMNSYILPDKRNVLILLTDGVHNVPSPSKQELYATIRQWCKFAKEKDAYAFYVMLTNLAQDPNLIKEINSTCRMSMIRDTDINFVELLPRPFNIKYNIKEDAGKQQKIKIECKKTIKIPSDLKIKVTSENNGYVKVDAIASIINGQISFNAKQLKAYQTMKSLLPKNYNQKILLHLSIVNDDKYPLVTLMRDEITLELINKPEKILRIHVQQP